MEAGNRSFDRNVPEETNRKIIDHIADFNLVYTEHARRHLLSEGIQHRRIYLTGSPMREVLEYHRPQINQSDILVRLDLKKRDYFIVSLHREENVDSSARLLQLADTLDALATAHDMQVIVSTHPRTRKRLEEIGQSAIDPRIQFLKPFGFSDYNQLQKSALCCVSDSGTIGEESSILQFPAVTIRNAMERPEALDTGNITIAGTNAERIVDCVSATIMGFEASPFPAPPAEYSIANCSQRVVRLILGTAKLAHRWMGIESSE